MNKAKPILVYTYIVTSSSSHNEVTCHVPSFISDKKIFFGSCKKYLRQKLKKAPELYQNNQLFIVGLSGSQANKGKQKTRKILWVGKINQGMTLKEAYFSGYKELSNENTGEPILHVKPEGNNYIYRDLSTHHNDSWKRDLSSKNNSLNRDICFECSNIFFARGAGLDIDDEILNIYRRSQLNEEIETEYYIFGKDKRGNAKGLAGKWLELKGLEAESLIELIGKRSKEKVNIKNHKVVSNKNGGC